MGRGKDSGPGLYTLLFAAHFHADYRPSYRAAAAKDAWGRCVAWFTST